MPGQNYDAKPPEELLGAFASLYNTPTTEAGPDKAELESRLATLMDRVGLAKAEQNKSLPVLPTMDEMCWFLYRLGIAESDDLMPPVGPNRLTQQLLRGLNAFVIEVMTEMAVTVNYSQYGMGSKDAMYRAGMEVMAVKSVRRVYEALKEAELPDHMLTMEKPEWWYRHFPRQEEGE